MMTGGLSAMLLIIGVSIAAIFIVFLFLIPIGTFFLALITTFRSRGRFSSSSSPSAFQTSLYKGRVSHTRYRPAVHAFSYPLFFCVLDLDEIDDVFGCKGALWPLSLLMQFRECDHLKNDEGLSKVEGAGNSVRARICRLVTEKTKGECRPSPKQRILLVTHLRYYGYCFNPVSFYYILKEKNDKDGKDEGDDKHEIDAIVAEVSNTPWNEMQCYVLHPESIDVDTVQAGGPRSTEIEPVSKFPRPDDGEISDKKKGSVKDSSSHHEKWEGINYVFQKNFHVSPFMSMDHTYDWTFWVPRNGRIMVSTSMIREGVPYFNAFFDIRRELFTPLRLCYQLIRLPFYCVIIQIWIHIEAFWLFMKGVEFIPHPKGSETAASQIIAKAMAPFFMIKEWLSRDKSE